MSYKRYVLLAYLVLAFVFARWLHADAQPSDQPSRYFLIMEGDVVALVDHKAKQITFTGSPVRVCVAQPTSGPHICLYVNDLQYLLKERGKTQ